jgi:predicted RNase H-like nuclease (RuvC/YqgF family)
MEIVDTLQIKSFGSNSPKADFVPPSDQLITLTYGQLQGLVIQAAQEAIQPLQNRIESLKGMIASQDKEMAALRSRLASLESLQESEISRVCVDIAQDRRRLSALEHPIKEPSKTETSRAEKIEKYLVSRPDHRAAFETLKGHLGVDKDRLKEAIKTLMDASPGRYGIVRTPGDKRKRILVMLPK